MAGPKKPSREILQHEIVEGADALDLPVIALSISGLSAGLGFFVALVKYSYAIREKFASEQSPLPVAGGAERRD
jgi:hypothetical protein